LYKNYHFSSVWSFNILAICQKSKQEQWPTYVCPFKRRKITKSARWFFFGLDPIWPPIIDQSETSVSVFFPFGPVQPVGLLTERLREASLHPCRNTERLSGRNTERPR